MGGRRARTCRTFKGCPHPDESQREALSRQLGMEPRQIKFWFQNRRTQEKVQYRRCFFFELIVFLTSLPCSFHFDLLIVDSFLCSRMGWCSTRR
jgi:hypothetical protein